MRLLGAAIRIFPIVAVWTFRILLVLYAILAIVLLYGCASHEGADGYIHFEIEEKPEVVTGCVVTHPPLEAERTLDLCKV